MVTAISPEQLLQQIEEGDFVAVRNLRFESAENRAKLFKVARRRWERFHVELSEVLSSIPMILGPDHKYKRPPDLVAERLAPSVAPRRACFTAILHTASPVRD